MNLVKQMNRNSHGDRVTTKPWRGPKLLEGTMRAALARLALNRRPFMRVRFLALPLLLLFSAQMGTCQGLPGIQMFSTNENGVDLATGNVNIEIPLRSKTGKIPFWSKIVGTSGMGVNPNDQWTGLLWGAFAYHDPTQSYFSVSVYNMQNCNYDGKSYSTEQVRTPTVIDSTGGGHAFSGGPAWQIGNGPAGSTCLNSQGTIGPFTANDGSGYILVVTNGNPTVYYPNGYHVTGACTIASGCLMQLQVTDPDGATITNSAGAVTDSLGTPVLGGLPASGDIINTTTFSYSDQSGNQQEYTVGVTLLKIATNFGCEGPFDGSPETLNMPTSITLPTGAQYSLSYEPTPGMSGYYTGRIAKITLPTGGSFSYAYSGGNNGINCTTHRVPVVTATVNDANGNVSTYTYSIGAPSGNTFSVTKTDPAENQTVYTFSGEFQTEIQVYQGSASGTPLLANVTCYNGANSSQTACVSASSVPQLPITQTDVYTSLNGGSPSLVETKYDNYGNVTDLKKYGYGASYPPSGTPLSEVQTTYNTGSTCGTLSPYIYDLPCTITTLGPSETLSSVQYTYNGAGHATQTQKSVSGSSSLTYYASYNGNGTMASSTDANGAVTNYSYTGTGGCNNLLLTSTDYPVDSLMTSQTWNCSGGVILSSTDANGKTTNYSYTDPLWRVVSITDPTTAETVFTYNATSVESALSVNSGSSTVDVLTTVDGLGRVVDSQTRQAPGSTNFDTVSDSYNTSGELAVVSMPCVVGTSAFCPSSPATTTTYDALARALTVTDGGGGTTTYSYNQNDVLVTIGPAPSGENTKRRQLEYDSLGRVTSVCEITAGTTQAPAGTCAQHASQTGYWTKYTYNTAASGASFGVTQNAQAASGSQQTRSYAYDLLGRLTSESNPESGTTTYTYDSASSCTSPNSFPGDLVRRVDNAGNATCISYDALHRGLSKTYTGPNASGMPNKYFVYDSATVDGVAMTYAKARLAEAYTASSQTGTKVTDVGFSYTARGQISDEYQSSPNSAGYYHENLLYWENGVTKQISDLPYLPTFTYAVDGEGRVNAISASAGQNPLSATTYNSASLPTAVTLGSGDGDAFTYDSNTYRITKYQFNINGQSYSGALTWNANATLGALVVTDPFNGADNQSCSYVHDDLIRIASVNCGASTWQQNFGYDAFGNLTKTVPTGGTGSSFQPTYSSSTNQMTNIAGFTPSYDADGNLLNDNSTIHTWDAESSEASVNSTSVTIDALDRAIDSGFQTATFYSPDGNLRVAFKGQLARRASLLLPGQGWADFDVCGGGLTEYDHPDNLGSIRLATSPGRSFLYSKGIAPFGESYAASETTGTTFTGQGNFFTLDTFEFPAREYSDQGRWAQPDPAGLAATDPTYPQSWNRYSYVANTPLNAVDPLGLECVWDDGSFDSADDPDTGSMTQCGNAGGRWFDPSTFQAPGGVDWSANPNTDLAMQLDPNQPVLAVTSWGTMPANIGTSSGSLDPFGLAVISDLSARVEPLNKLSDCTGNAIADEVPLGLGRRLFGAPNPDPLGNKARSLSKALSPNTGGKLLGTVPWNYEANVGRVVSGLDNLDLPQLSDIAAIAGAKLAPLASTASKFLAVAGPAWMAGNVARNTYACYSK
jgi:RHS repeat-associated protein